MAHSVWLLVPLATILFAVNGQLVFNPDRQAPEEKVPLQITFDQTNKAVCPESEGVYEDATFCDAYWVCKNGAATEKFCEDGLVFDPKKAGHADPCDTPHVVHCGTRQELQEPTFPNEFCPRKYGTFEHPDPKVCNVYYQCVNGVHTEVTCATGLYFNSTQGSCNWPAISQRTGCVDKPKMSSDGAFSCPGGTHLDANGIAVPHPSFPNADDCSKFYVCLNGETPQEASCDKGLVFDERSMICALPETVPECEGWYANDPAFAHYYDSAPATGRADPGRQDVAGG
ncbi:protein obstructor-E [Hyalella azteca]|uniref:Protein obstructor-E n=1 Tax=Hyalella azteca TaxID=294128 RepID=A0A8B7P734_HYAAZ|nr:protein obstructor-E [Hyalella azteca]